MKEFLEVYFPFYIKASEDLKIKGLGSSWSENFQEIQEGTTLSDHFEVDLLGWNNIEKMKIKSRDPFQLISKKNKNIIFKSSLWVEDDGYLFIMQPILTTGHFLEKVNLSFKNFSPVDSIFDLLLLLNSEKDMKNRLRKVNHDLEKELKSRDVLLQSLPSAIAWYSSEGEFVDSNNLFQKYDKSLETAIQDLITLSKDNQSSITKELEFSLGDKKTFFMCHVCPYEFGFILIATDITEKVNNQRELDEHRTKERFHSYLESLGEMAGGIAHEINNPLMIIMGHTKALLHSFEPIDGQRRLDKIYKTAERIHKIVLSMRSLARRSTSTEREIVDIIDIIKDVINISSEKLKANGVKIDVLEKKKNIKFNCNYVEISQVLFNLISNACDAIEEMESKSIKIILDSDGDFGFVKVVDSGKGVHPALLDKILEPFFTTKPPGKGTGLGLSISRQIMEDHDSEIYIDAKSQNTCFILKFSKAALEDEKEKVG